MNQDESEVTEMSEVKQMRQEEEYEKISHEQIISQEQTELLEETIDHDQTLDHDQSQNETFNSVTKPFREQDIFLPIANVARIMKNSIPPNGKIAKEAKECVQECVSEFISFITSEAAERCQQEKRKTINGEDILFALNTLGFDPYVEPLKLYLTKYRESIKGDKSLGDEMGEMGTESIHLTPQQMVTLSEGGQHVLIQGDVISQADGQFIFKSE